MMSLSPVESWLVGVGAASPTGRLFPDSPENIIIEIGQAAVAAQRKRL